MSVEIRRRVTGDCPCGTPQPIGAPITCRHWIECDWGILDNPEADPKHGLRHLIVLAGYTVRRLLNFGPEPGTRGGTVSATVDAEGERIFMHLDHDLRRTTWELFDAYWSDGKGSEDIYVGRWPD